MHVEATYPDAKTAVPAILAMHHHIVLERRSLISTQVRLEHLFP